MLYRRLAPDQIRLLYIGVDNSISGFCLDLVEASLDRGATSSGDPGKGAVWGKKSISYAALSYTWLDYGSESERDYVTVDVKRVDVDKNQEDSRLDITKGLFNAFQSFVANNVQRGFYLWADQVCIDQSSNYDKNQQVPLMRQIYERAAKMYLYLGSQSSDSDRAIGKIEAVTASSIPQERFQDVSSFWMHRSDIDSDQSTPDRSSRRDWAAVSTLISRPWFTRSWVWPEVTAKAIEDVLVFCGTTQISWLSICRLVNALLNTEPANISEGYARDLIIVHRITKMDCLRQARDRGHGQPLLHLLYAISACGVSDYRDKLYCMLPFAEEASASEQLHIDYSLHYSEIYTSVVIWCIKHYRDLRFLDYCSSSALAQPDSPPTWVPDWSRLSNASPWPAYRSAKDQTPLFDPFGDPRCDLIVLQPSPTNVKSLRLTGRLLATIGCVKQENIMSSPSDDHIRALCQPRNPGFVCPHNHMCMKEVLFRTLCIDVKRVEPGEEIDLDQESGYYERGADTKVVDSGSRQYDYVRYNTLGRKLFYTSKMVKRPELLGLGPQDLIEGDEVWALKGGHMLYVLRKVTEAASDDQQWPLQCLDIYGQEHFSLDRPKDSAFVLRRFVGTCFILGLMDGVANLSDTTSKVCLL